MKKGFRNLTESLAKKFGDANESIAKAKTMFKDKLADFQEEHAETRRQQGRIRDQLADDLIARQEIWAELRPAVARIAELESDYEALQRNQTEAEAKEQTNSKLIQSIKKKLETVVQEYQAIKLIVDGLPAALKGKASKIKHDDLARIVKQVRDDLKEQKALTQLLNRNRREDTGAIAVLDHGMKQLTEKLTEHIKKDSTPTHNNATVTRAKFEKLTENNEELAGLMHIIRVLMIRAASSSNVDVKAVEEEVTRIAEKIDATGLEKVVSDAQQTVQDTVEGGPAGLWPIGLASITKNFNWRFKNAQALFYRSANMLGVHEGSEIFVAAFFVVLIVLK